MKRRGRHRGRGALVVALLVAACATTARDGLDATRLPPRVRADYAVFARRCSKCHQLARPLGSGIHDDAMWADYVERMRRQPGSGISPADTIPILRFLHYYSHDYSHEYPVALGGRRDAGGND